MIKKQTYTTIALLLVCCGLAAVASSCSNIDEADRLIAIESELPIDTTVVDPNADLDSLYNLPAEQVARRVLIEDHTGQTCANCPTMTYFIHQLQQLYGNLIVPVAIQSDYLGIMEPEGLANELGNYYFNQLNFTPKVKPAVMVSRYYNSVLTTSTDVSFYVENVLPIPTPLDIRVKAVRDEENVEQVNIDAKVVCCTDTTISGKLQVWVTEDDIIARQDSLNGVHIADYRHNHVLRAAVNGNQGEAVSVSGKADEKEFHYTLTLQPAWKPMNLSIVAFVYNDNEVVQVTRMPIRAPYGPEVFH